MTGIIGDRAIAGLLLENAALLTEPSGKPPSRRVTHEGAILSGWPTKLPVIPVTSQTSNGPSLVPSCLRCRAGQTVEDVPGVQKGDLFVGTRELVRQPEPDRHESQQSGERENEH